MEESEMSPQLAYYHRNRKKSMARNKAWKLAHPEEVKANKCKLYWENPEKARAQKRQDYVNHLDRRRLEVKEYYERTKEIQSVKKRAFARTAEGKRYNRNANLRTKYGIDQAAVEQLIKDQNGICPICLNKLEYNWIDCHKQVAVDHDHVTKKVRGILHPKCNRGIGFLLESPEVLERAAAYLREKS